MTLRQIKLRQQSTHVQPPLPCNILTMSSDPHWFKAVSRTDTVMYPRKLVALFFRWTIHRFWSLGKLITRKHFGTMELFQRRSDRHQTKKLICKSCCRIVATTNSQHYRRLFEECIAKKTTESTPSHKVLLQARANCAKPHLWFCVILTQIKQITWGLYTWVKQ